MTFEDGQVVKQKVPIAKESCKGESESIDLPGVAVHARLQSLDDDKAVELAVRYQLVTEYTICVLVFDRGEDQKAEDIPALRKVPQVLAAGWGGMGAVKCYDMAMEAPALSSKSLSIDLSESGLKNGDMDYLNISAFLRPEVTNDFSLFITRLNDLYSDRFADQLNIEKISELVSIGLDQEVADRLLEFVDDGHEEISIVICFLMELSKAEAGKGLSGHISRLIRQANKKNVVSAPLVEAVPILIGRN